MRARARHARRTSADGAASRFLRSRVAGIARPERGELDQLAERLSLVEVQLVGTVNLPEHLQRYWTTTYASYPGDAAGPLCQLISRLQTNPVVAATFGSPRSTYDPRRAMDERAIILMCPPSGKEHLVTNLLMQGHIDAARSRADLPADR
ncbi:MAG: hypothetical protein LC777_22145, partial [Actinobacteria bacterium]|nr:hypothetical protein [Actinomycetota bacterium]